MREHDDLPGPENRGALEGSMDFSASYTENLPAVLERLNISLAFTSYQAGRLMLVRSDGQQLDVNYKNFHRPMGLAVTPDSLTLGVFTQVIKFQREDGLLAQMKQPLPPITDDMTAPTIHVKDAEAPAARAQPHEIAMTQQRWEAYQQELHQAVDGRVDGCFITRSAHYTGMINIHDIGWGAQGLWAVNSSFSCLCTLGPDASFVPRWKPHVITLHWEKLVSPPAGMGHWL